MAPRTPQSQPTGCSRRARLPLVPLAQAWLKRSDAVRGVFCWPRSTMFATASAIRVGGSRAPRDICLAACSTRAMRA